MSKIQAHTFRLHSTIAAETSMQPLHTLALAELLDTFHNRAATDPRDKIYALLGLSSDTESPLTIRADYTKSWATLFREVITQILGVDVFVCTKGEKEQAIISGPGCPLGVITRNAETGIYSFRSPSFHGIRGQENVWTASLPESNHTKTILSGDILCLLKGARWPSVVRPCGDHFDIIVIAHPRPPLVFLERSMSAHGTRIQTLTWKEFTECVSNFPRQFELVRDWQTEKTHIEGFLSFAVELADERDITGQERLLNTTRILEDVGKRDLLSESLKARARPNNHIWMEEHFTLLSHVCNHWESYICLKAYLTQLHWCGWLMSNKITTKVALVEYWTTEGILDLDFLTISSLLKPQIMLEEHCRRTHRHPIEDFGERSMTTLLCALFPDYSRLVEERTDKGRLLALPVNIRYLIHIALGRMKDRVRLSDEAIDVLFASSRMKEATKLSLAIVSDFSTSDLLPSDRLLRKLHTTLYACDLLSLLFEDCTHDTTAVYTILKAVYAKARSGNQQTTFLATSQVFLATHVHTLDWWVRETDLCDVLVEHWTEGVAPVLQFLCETFDIINPPIQKDLHNVRYTKVSWCMGSPPWKRSSAIPQKEVVAMARKSLLHGIRRWMAIYQSSPRYDPQDWDGTRQTLLDILRGTAATGTYTDRLKILCELGTA
jgi:hypothetical protein